MLSVLQIPDPSWPALTWALLPFHKKPLLGIAAHTGQQFAHKCCCFTLWIHSNLTRPFQRLIKEDRDPCFMGNGPLRDKVRFPKENTQHAVEPEKESLKLSVVRCSLKNCSCVSHWRVSDPKPVIQGEHKCHTLLTRSVFIISIHLSHHPLSQTWIFSL